MPFCHLLIFFCETNSFRNKVRVVKSLDPDFSHHFVRPNLGL